MIPIDQTRFGFPEGNCLAACLCSILEVPLDESLRFHGDPAWQSRLREFMVRHGSWVHFVDNILFPVTPRGVHVGGGPSPRGIAHACVFEDGRLIHDPHPSRLGIFRVERWYVIEPLGL